MKGWVEAFESRLSSYARVKFLLLFSQGRRRGEAGRAGPAALPLIPAYSGQFRRADILAAQSYVPVSFSRLSVLSPPLMGRRAGQHSAGANAKRAAPGSERRPLVLRWPFQPSRVRTWRLGHHCLLASGVSWAAVRFGLAANESVPSGLGVSWPARCRVSVMVVFVSFCVRLRFHLSGCVATVFWLTITRDQRPFSGPALL